jgi:hypothetical protein
MVKLEYAYCYATGAELAYFREMAGIIHRYFDANKGVVKKDANELQAILNALTNVVCYAKA